MKPWAYLAILVAIIGAIGGVYATGHNSGYDKRDVEIRDAAVIAQNKAINKGIADWVVTQEQAEATIVIEERIVEKIRVVEREIPTVVEKIVTVQPECADLGIDYARLLNEQIRASNDHQVSDTEFAGNLVEGMPETQ